MLGRQNVASRQLWRIAYAAAGIILLILLGLTQACNRTGNADGSQDENNSTVQPYDTMKNWDADTDSLEGIAEDSAVGNVLQPVAPNASFEKEFRELAKALEKQDWQAVNKFIEPASGIYIIDRPGAIDRIQKATSIEAFNQKIYQGSSRLIKLDCPLNFNPLPKADCNRTYDMCMAAPTDTFHRLSMLKEAFDKYDFKENASGLGLAELKAAEKKVSMLALSDAIVLGFYRKAEKWYLLTIDLAQYSCSA